MAFCELKYYSSALQKHTAASILLPEGDVKGPFPVLYLLHGQSDDHTIWCRRTSIERYVSGLPLIVVMPDTGRGWYTDAVHGPAWETAIVRDLVNYIDMIFPTKAERSGRCLTGLSMGGYGSLKLALKFPDLFCAGVSHSGALTYAHTQFETLRDEVSDWVKEMRLILGDNYVGGDNDLFALAKGLKKKDRPSIRIDCGTEDFLIEANRFFHAYLTEIKYTHEYQEHSGAHTWEYWDDHIQDSLKFVLKSLGLKK